MSAVYVTNRIATSSLDKMTPVEAFKRQVQPGLSDAEYMPDISHLRILGCKTYVNIPKERRIKSAKLAPHAEEGYLVGFEGSKIYRVYLPGRAQKIVRTSHCVFDESEPNNPKNPETDDLTCLTGEITNSQTDQSEYSNNLPEITQSEDGGLDQEYDPLPESTIVVDVGDSEEDYILAPRQRGRPKGSKNKPKDSAQTTIELGSETPSQGSEMEPSQDSQTPLDLNRRTRSQAPALLAMQVSGYIAAVTDHEEPSTVHEAKNSPDWTHWLDAMRAELKSLVKNKTWEVISVSKSHLKTQGKKALGAKWVFKIKRGVDGQIV
jgi:hypothetical protein